MIVFESREVRRIVGRLEKGERLVEALRELAEERRITTGWIHGAGTVAWAELSRWDPGARELGAARRIDTPAELVSLGGNVSFRDAEPFVSLHGSLAWESAGGPRTAAGRLVDAGVVAVELVVECYDDLGLRREEDATTGMALWTGMSLPVGRGAPETDDVAEPPPPADGPVSWADVAAASAEPRRPAREAPRPRRRERTGRGEPRAVGRPRPVVPDPIPEKRKTTEEEFFEEPIPEKGDYVDHRVFGLCRVEDEDTGGGLVIRLPSGARKPINIEVLEVLPARVEGDKVIYPLRPKRRR